jgi:hypothetical protein
MGSPRVRRPQVPTSILPARFLTVTAHHPRKKKELSIARHGLLQLPSCSTVYETTNAAGARSQLLQTDYRWASQKVGMVFF